MKSVRMIMAIAAVLLTSGTVFAASLGECGDNITWTLDDNGNLVLTGSGKMWDYENETPWGYEIKTVSIGDGIMSIGDYAFWNCRGLTSVKIPNSVTSIGHGAFSHCYNLMSVEIPNSVTNIRPYAFCECRSLTSVTIPSSVTHIGENAFCYCKNLTSVTIPNSVTHIGNNAFERCDNLTSVTSPSSVKYIGTNAFKGSGCKVLSTYETSARKIFAGTWKITGGNSSITLTLHTDGTVTGTASYSFDNLRVAPLTGIKTRYRGSATVSLSGTFTAYPVTDDRKYPYDENDVIRFKDMRYRNMKTSYTINGVSRNASNVSSQLIEDLEKAFQYCYVRNAKEGFQMYVIDFFNGWGRYKMVKVSSGAKKAATSGKTTAKKVARKK